MPQITSPIYTCMHNLHNFIKTLHIAIKLIFTKQTYCLDFVSPANRVKYEPICNCQAIFADIKANRSDHINVGTSSIILAEFTNIQKWMYPKLEGFRRSVRNCTDSPMTTKNYFHDDLWYWHPSCNTGPLYQNPLVTKGQYCTVMVVPLLFAWI